jgi:hypothetical protein
MDTTDRSVSGIIAAFRASLQEFKSYRERKRKVKKIKAAKGKEDATSGDELKLSHSLRQGAVDVQREYDRHFRAYGDGYAVGDGENCNTKLENKADRISYGSNGALESRTYLAEAQHLFT